MSIALRSVSSAGTSFGGFDFTIPAPAGVQSSDYLIAHVSYHQGDNSPVTPPSGWTLLRKEGSTQDSGGASGWIFTKIAGGSEPGSYLFTLSDFRNASGGIVAYTGVKNALPIDVSSVGISTNTTAPASPSITTLYTAPRLLWFLAARDNEDGDTATAPAGMTQRWRANSVDGNACVSLFADLAFSGPGASGIKTGAVSPAAHAVAHALFLSPNDETVNHPPTASAGPDRITEVGTGVVLDGSASADVDPGDTLTYVWTHLSGPNGTAQLSNVAIAAPTFTPTAAGIDSFRITITDPGMIDAYDEVTITTTPVGVRFSGGSGTSTIASVALPADAAAGDVAFFACCMRPSLIPPTMTGGWQAVMVGSQGFSSPDIQMWVFRKRLTVGDLNTSPSMSIATDFDFHWAAQIITVRSLHATAPQPGRMVTTPLTVPRVSYNEIVGASGSTSYQYVVTAVDAVGETVASTNHDVSGAAAVLNNSNYVKLFWNPIVQATSYKVYGRTPAGTKFLLGTADTTSKVGLDEYVCGYSDKGNAPGPETPPTQGPTEWLLDGLTADFLGTPWPERLYTTYLNAKLLVFAAAQFDAAAPTATVTDPAGLSPMLTTIGPNDKLVLHSSYQLLSAAGNIGQRIFTPSDFAASWTVMGLALRPTGSNGTPTARAGFDQDAEVGATVHLDASLSYDEDGDTLAYSWVQTVGPTVTLSNANTMFPSFTMPGESVTLRVTVSDPSSTSTTDTVTITPLIIGRPKIKKGNGTWQAAPV